MILGLVLGFFLEIDHLRNAYRTSSKICHGELYLKDYFQGFLILVLFLGKFLGLDVGVVFSGQFLGPQGRLCNLFLFLSFTLTFISSFTSRVKNAWLAQGLLEVR